MATNFNDIEITEELEARGKAIVERLRQAAADWDQYCRELAGDEYFGTGGDSLRHAIDDVDDDVIRLLEV